MNMDTLNKFSENNIDVNGALGWWCHIPKIGRGNSPELQHHRPRSRSSPLLDCVADLELKPNYGLRYAMWEAYHPLPVKGRSGAVSPERRALDQPSMDQVLPEVAYIERTRLRSAKAELYSDSRGATAQFTLRPPAEPLTLLGDTLPLCNATQAHERRDKVAWGVFEQGAASLALCDEEPVWLAPRIARQPRLRAQRERTASARRTTAREPGGARRAVRGLLRKLIASLPLPSQTTSHEYINAKDNPGSYCNAAISVQVLDPLAPRTCRSISVQAKTDPCRTNETVMQTGNVGEAKPRTRKDGWMGGVRALRDSHVRLVLKQLRHIERLNRALDQAGPKH